MMKTLLRTSFLCALALLLAAPLAAHAEEVIYLQDGSVLHGRIVSHENGVTVLQTSAGTLRIDDTQIVREEEQPDQAAPGATPAPPAPGTTAAPGATPPPQQPTAPGDATPPPVAPPPGPAATRTPWPYATPSPTPWPYATPTPAPQTPPSATGGAPGYNPPRTPPPGYRGAYRRPVPYKPFYLEAKLGYHTFTGAGWSKIPDERYRFDGAGVEGTMRFLLQQDRDWRLDLVGDAGVYGGSDDCVGSITGGCGTLSLASLYLDAGGRLTLMADPFYVYGQAGIGALSANETYSDSFGDTTSSESRGAFAAHVSGGLGIELDPIVFFGEVKWIHADVQFSDQPYALGMGGVLVMAGAGIHF